MKLLHDTLIYYLPLDCLFGIDEAFRTECWTTRVVNFDL